MKLLPYPYQSYGWGDEHDTRWMLEKIEGRGVAGLRVADVGAGTGILGLRAAELGAHVTWYESDPSLRELVRHNVAANNFNSGPWVLGRFPDEWDGTQYDIIFANIGQSEIEWLHYAKEWYTTEDTNG